jgi:hypothetical protein
VGSGKKILTSRGNGAPQETEGRLQVIFLITSGCTDVLGPEESFTFVPPTTTCCLPRLPATSHDYLLPPTTTCCLPRLPAASYDSLVTTSWRFLLPKRFAINSTALKSNQDSQSTFPDALKTFTLAPLLLFHTAPESIIQSLR